MNASMIKALAKQAVGPKAKLKADATLPSQVETQEPSERAPASAASVFTRVAQARPEDGPPKKQAGATVQRRVFAPRQGTIWEIATAVEDNKGDKLIPARYIHLSLVRRKNWRGFVLFTILFVLYVILQKMRIDANYGAARPPSRTHPPRLTCARPKRPTVRGYHHALPSPTLARSCTPPPRLISPLALLRQAIKRTRFTSSPGTSRLRLSTTPSARSRRP